MFRHQGKSRTLKHNLHIAIILSFVAGIVNVTGFLAFHQFTTNVTGHFAQFINDFVYLEFWKGLVYFLYIFSFLFGSFLSSFLIEKFRQNKSLNVFVLPTLIECFILSAIAISSNFMIFEYTDLIVCSLLFSMGLQNSFVTKISNAIVRTTHLTGLFTDLGIDFSQLLFPKSFPDRAKIKSNLRLRIYIISFFFLGGSIGGFLYSKMGFELNTLIVAVVVLLTSLFYDDFRFKILQTQRKFRKRMRIAAGHL